MAADHFWITSESCSRLWARALSALRRSCSRFQRSCCSSHSRCLRMAAASASAVLDLRSGTTASSSFTILGNMDDKFRFGVSCQIADHRTSRRGAYATSRRRPDGTSFSVVEEWTSWYDLAAFTIALSSRTYLPLTYLSVTRSDISTSARPMGTSPI